ncbi:MAG: site-specific tyrosine recombinase/integron integrase [Candidatus Babeliales bacterium]
MSIVTKFEAYLLTERRVAKNTFQAYKQDLAQFILFLTNHTITIEQATVADVKRYLSYLKSNAISSRSMARKISALKLFFAYAHEHAGFVDITHDMQAPKLEKKLPTFLSEQEIAHLLQVADADTSEQGVRNKVMLYLLYVSGMRISELTGLRLSDVHADTGFITIRGKGGKERMVPVPQDMIDLLHTYMQTVRGSDHLFPVRYGGKIKAISRQACWHVLNGLWKQTGIARTISPHMLRHSLATHMLKNGADLRSLQLLLGHENISTVQIYTHVETTHLRTVYDTKHPRSYTENNDE